MKPYLTKVSLRDLCAASWNLMSHRRSRNDKTTKSGSASGADQLKHWRDSERQFQNTSTACWWRFAETDCVVHREVGSCTRRKLGFFRQLAHLYDFVQKDFTKIRAPTFKTFFGWQFVQTERQHALNSDSAVGTKRCTRRSAEATQGQSSDQGPDGITRLRWEQTPTVLILLAAAMRSVHLHYCDHQKHSKY